MAGGDVSVFHSHLQELPELIVRWGREMHFAFLALRRMGKPVLASVHGAVAGAGFSLMCAADLAIAATDTRFTLAYANIGANPDGGSTHFLPRLIGYRKAMELALLPERFDAETARSLGLVNWVVAGDKLAEETAKIAQRLAAGPTKAYAEAKRLMNQSLATSIETQMEEELFAFSRCARTAGSFCTDSAIGRSCCIISPSIAFSTCGRLSEMVATPRSTDSTITALMRRSSAKRCCPFPPRSPVRVPTACAPHHAESRQP